MAGQLQQCSVVNRANCVEFSSGSTSLGSKRDTIYNSIDIKNFTLYTLELFCGIVNKRRKTTL